MTESYLQIAANNEELARDIVERKMAELGMGANWELAH